MLKFVILFLMVFAASISSGWFIAFSGGVPFGTGWFGAIMFFSICFGAMAGAGLVAVALEYTENKGGIRE